MTKEPVPASTPRIGRMLREPQGSQAGVGGADAVRRIGRTHRRHVASRAGRRLLIGCIVIAGVALTVATDFLQLHSATLPASAQQVAARSSPAGSPAAVR